MLIIDPKLFSDDAISKETRDFNAELLAKMSSLPDTWGNTPKAIRNARLLGRGPFPIEPEDQHAVDFTVDTPDHTVPVRSFRPLEREARGTFLHIHGGGWVVGSHAAHDSRLRELSERTGLNCISIDYRLAPEYPYPAGPNDCENVARWLLSGDHDFNTDFLAIGGESAGAHLSALTLLRLRQDNVPCAFQAAVLTAGAFDLGQTASAANWGAKRLVLSTRDIRLFSSQFAANGEDRRSPELSPLFAPLHDMPPALFSVGTSDALLDDSLQMATRWHSKNGNAELDIASGGCHVFQSFRHLKIAKESNAKIDDFLNQQISSNRL